MKNIYKNISEYCQIRKTAFQSNPWPCITIFILALIPIFYTWEKLAIGGDIVIPFNSTSLEKFLYQWISVQNGQYFSLNYYPLYIFYKFTEFIRLNIYQTSYVLLFLLNVIAGFGIYKLTELFYAKEKSYLYIIPITFYLLSPALLNAWHYVYIYTFIPCFLYFIFKVVRNKEIKISDLIWLNVLLSFSSLDLPNPKYIFYLFLISFIIFFLSLLLRLVDFKFLFKNLGKFILFILLSIYLFLPLGYFATNYSAEAYGVHTKAGYKDTGKMMDFGSATVSKMFRLHHDGIALNTPDQENYRNNAIVTLVSYIFIILIIWSLFFTKKKIEKEEYKFQFILFILILVYLFFASGSNPPLGFVYEYIVSKFSLFAFLRTTAGAVFFLSPLYAVLLFNFVRNVKRAQPLVALLLLIAVGIVGYPLLNGVYYKSFNSVNPYTDRNQYGFKIPEEYFRIRDFIDSKKIDAKIFFYQTNLTYINTVWGFFGAPIYNMLYASYNIGRDNVYYNILNNNVGFVFKDDSLMDDKKPIDIKIDIKKIKKDGYLNLFNVENFLPRFFIPKLSRVTLYPQEKKTVIVSNSGSQIRSAIFIKQQNEGKDDLLNNLNGKVNGDKVLEFKKINPTKYRVIIHNATGKFPLVFSENFHDGWKVYLGKDVPIDLSAANLKDYKVLEGNADYQATADELKEFISKGFISSVGNGKPKNIEHKKWEDNAEKLDYIEPYKIDFISKHFQGTIQNNNLPDGHFYETWFKNPIEDNNNHLMVNGYANSWLLDTEKICSQNPDCHRNTDGSYDFEVIIEFWPQRLFYVGLFVSGATLFLCLSYFAFSFIGKKASS